MTDITTEETRESEAAGTSSAFRVVVIVSDPMQPEWVARLVQQLRDLVGMDVFALTLPAPRPERAVAVGASTRLLYSGFKRIDRRRVRQDVAAERVTDLRQILRPGHALSDMQGHGPFTVGLYLREGTPDQALCQHFERGIIAVQGPGELFEPVVNEVLAGAPVFQYTLLLWRNGATAPFVVQTASLRTDRLSLAASAHHYHVHLRYMLVARLSSMAQGEVCRPPKAAAESRSALLPAPATTGFMLMARSLLRLAALRIERGLRHRFQQEDWALAVVRAGGAQNPLGFDPHAQTPSILLPPDGTIWADPFPIRRDGRVYVFVEEMKRSTRRGHISLMELTEQLQPRVIGPVLSAPYHLSYPFVFEWRGSTFMIPETEQNRTVELYRCAAWPDSWTQEAVLLDGVSAADATLTQANGKWWLFTTMNPPRDAHADWNTNLYIFHADTPLGPWLPHGCNPVKSDVRSSRSAGRLFWRDGRLYRPSQDCAARYGHAIVLNEVTRLDTGGFEEREVWRVHGWRSDIVGVHTVNREGDVLLLDCKIRRRKRS